MEIASEDGMKIIQLRLRRDSNTGEWVIRIRSNGKPLPEATYFTDDRKDAEDTQRVMKANYEKWGDKVEIC